MQCNFAYMGAASLLVWHKATTVSSSFERCNLYTALLQNKGFRGLHMQSAFANPLAKGPQLTCVNLIQHGTQIETNSSGAGNRLTHYQEAYLREPLPAWHSNCEHDINCWQQPHTIPEGWFGSLLIRTTPVRRSSPCVVRYITLSPSCNPYSLLLKTHSTLKKQWALASSQGCHVKYSKYHWSNFSSRSLK
jgi:hypothetical protein